jgi:hypothetical protein
MKAIFIFCDVLPSLALRPHEWHSWLPRWDFANAVGRNSEPFLAAVEQDLDKLASKFKLAEDKGNAAALVSFLVFDAIADTKIRKHEPDGLTMDGWSVGV